MFGCFLFLPLSKMRLIHRNSIVCRRRKFGTCYCQKRVLITKKVDFPSERIAVTRIFPIVLPKLIMASFCFAHCLLKDLVTFYLNRFCFLICSINLQICDCFCLPNIVRCPSCGRYINVFEFSIHSSKRERVWNCLQHFSTFVGLYAQNGVFKCVLMFYFSVTRVCLVI